ncbi:hypothetical protein ILUMI_16170 [Ignelater luminosus]|uniref:Uncharacterized protein n=1 Tax=Ignelater luminosus TaxID=2038154 RepID=A0A8K0CM95_IGNLU|nr:hypothetical protein ILUMI_16170 [Ignelater luminosus]
MSDLRLEHRSVIRFLSKEGSTMTQWWQYEDFFCRIVARDKTWVYHWYPPTKQESMQGVHKGSPPPKKAKMQFPTK